MVRLRANEVVDDRVLLARAQAEIKRLKRRLQEALEDTLLGVAEDYDDGGNADEENGGGCPQPDTERGPDGTTKTKIGALGGWIVESGREGAKGGQGDAENAEIATEGPNGGGKPCLVSTNEEQEKTAVRVSAAATPTVEKTQRRQTAKLIAENEHLREDNERLRADVQRLVLQSNKQRLRRHRRQQRSVGRAGNIPTGPRSAPIDWSMRYSDAAADVRRRRLESSHRANSPARVKRSASSSRVGTMERKRHASPTTTPARVYGLPKFCRRQFGVDGDVGQGEESEGEPVEDRLSGEEIQAILRGDVEADAAESMLALQGNPEKGDEEAVAAKQLEMFRRELQGRAAGGSFVRRGGGGGEEGAGAAPANSGIVAERFGSAGSGNQDEERDIEKFLENSQRLEDLMFEAQGREKRRLRVERGHLASAREKRLELEAQLAEVTGGARIADGTDTTDTHLPESTSTVKPAVTTSKNHVSRLPVNSTTPSPSAEEGRGQPASSKVWNHQQQQKHHQPPPPCFDGAVSARDESGTTTTKTPSTILGVAERDKTNNGHHYNRSGDGEKRIGWAEQPSTSAADTTTYVAATPTPTTTIPATAAATTAMMMAVLAPPEQSGGDSSGAPRFDRRGSHASNNPALGARRTLVPATKPPHERRRQQQAGRVFPAATPASLPSSSPSPGSRQHRPATSTGGPPTESNRARSRSRSRGNQQLRSGRVSRSLVRGGRLAFLEPSSPRREGNDGGSSEQATKRGLAYGVADLGLRLKVVAATTADFAHVQLEGASQTLKGGEICCLITFRRGS